MPHEHHSQTADKWTKISAAGEAASSFISNTYWLATLLDIAIGGETDVIGISYYALGFGLATASFSAAGTVYSHYLLNQQYQAGNADNNFDIESGTEKLRPARLNLLQKAALAGDYISHIGEVSGPLTFVADLASANQLPRWGKALVQCGATLFGAFASIANVRTCKNSMQNYNECQNSTAGYERTPLIQT